MFICCYKLATITLPDSIVSIKDSAFGSCDALESVTIPKNVVKIGKEAFNGCFCPKTVYIPEGLEYPSNAFLSGAEITTYKVD